MQTSHLILQGLKFVAYPPATRKQVMQSSSDHTSISSTCMLYQWHSEGGSKPHAARAPALRFQAHYTREHLALCLKSL